MISKEKASLVASVATERGMVYAAKHFGVSLQSIERYVKLHNQFLKEGHVTKIPKILNIDIETSPLIGAFWQLKQRYIPHGHILRDKHLLSVSCKWLGDSEYIDMPLTPKQAREGDDRDLAHEVWKLFDEADILIAHNGKHFDFKELNTRFLLNGINHRPSPYQMIDTLEQARKHFRFTSNTQDFLTKALKLPQKRENEGMGLWLRCIEGDQSALDEMMEYNHHDTGGLEELYLKLRPWMTQHPNVALLYDDDTPTNRCVVCGGKECVDNGEYLTPMNIYKSVRCTKCGTPRRRRKSRLTKEDRSVLDAPLAR